MKIQRFSAQNGAPSRDLEHAGDVELMVYHMKNSSPEVWNCFMSDMGFVADYLNEGNFDGRREQRIVHLETRDRLYKEFLIANN